MSVELKLSTQQTSERSSSAALYREHAQRVAGWASRLGGPRSGADLEDVVQEIFLRVHRALPGFRGEAEITTWLYRITENVVRARRRKEKIRRFFGFQPAPEVDAIDLPSPHPTPEGDAERAEKVRSLYAALERVPERYRNAFILFEIDGLAGEEVARLLGVKIQTLWVQLSRARQLVITELQNGERRGTS